MGIKKKILVLKGGSKGNVLRVASDEISLGFQKTGYEVVTIDLLDLEQRVQFHAILETQEYAFIFSCQGVALGTIKQAKKQIGQLSKTPYIAWIFDDLMYHCDFLLKIEETDKEICLLEVDDEMREIAQCINPVFHNIFHILHGGFEVDRRPVKKDLDILYPGNFGEEPVMEQILLLSGEDYSIFSNLIYETIDLLLNEKMEITVREAFAQILESHQIDYTGQTHLELLATGALKYVDMYIRYYYRKRTLIDLLEAGFYVSVIGEGYSEMSGRYPNLTVYGRKDIKEVISFMARSKIVCNPCPPVFRAGAHERIFSAMLNKAVCLTPYSDYQENLFGNNLLFYKINKKEEMIEKVRYCIEHFDDLSSNLEETYLFAQNHTWEKRGEEIIGLYEQYFRNDLG